jgi:hypothetical protein
VERGSKWLRLLDAFRPRVDRMTKGGAVVIRVFVAAVLGFVVAFLLGARSVGNWAGGLALNLSGWAASGHLVTLDDDMPGRWSNPDRSRGFWLKSLGQLAIKVVVFAGVLWLFVTLRARTGI